MRKCIMYLVVAVPIAPLIGHAVISGEESQICLPQMAAVPVIDGNVDTREWTDAALLPPISRLPNGASDGHDTRFYMGWQGGKLFFAVECNRSLEASTGASVEGDHLEIVLVSDGGPKRVIKVGPAMGSLSTGKNLEGWVCKSVFGKTGWTAEIQLPIAAIGAKGVWKLQATLKEPSIGRTSPTLVQHLRFSDRRLACRFTEAGEFSNGKYQGGELEIINAGSTDAKANVLLILNHDDKEIGRTEQKNVPLRAESNNRFRVVAPRKAGEYSVEYAVEVDGTILTKGAFDFEASGPIRVALLPFYLLRNGVYVRTEILNAKPADVTLQLLDPRGRKTLYETSLRTAADGTGEGFVSMKRAKPGPYLIRVEARQEGDSVATFTALLKE